jgi:hypothetical protein
MGDLNMTQAQPQFQRSLLRIGSIAFIVLYLLNMLAMIHG